MGLVTLSVSLSGALTAPLSVLLTAVVGVVVHVTALVVSLVLVMPDVLGSVLVAAATVTVVVDFRWLLVLLTVLWLSLVELMIVIDSSRDDTSIGTRDIDTGSKDRSNSIVV